MHKLFRRRQTVCGEVDQRAQAMFHLQCMTVLQPRTQSLRQRRAVPSRAGFFVGFAATSRARSCPPLQRSTNLLMFFEKMTSTAQTLEVIDQHHSQQRGHQHVIPSDDVSAGPSNKQKRALRSASGRVLFVYAMIHFRHFQYRLWLPHHCHLPSIFCL